MPCEVNAIDSAVVSATQPGIDDLVWFVLPDGSVVFRKWSTLLQAATPDDAEYEVGVTSGAPVAGEFTWTKPAWIGKRIRLFRSGALQNRAGGAGVQKYSFDFTTGAITVNVAWDANEIITIQQY